MTGDIHDAHVERAALRKTRLAPEKLFSILLFGCLTQLAIAISHKGRSLAVAVMLFSVAFSASIAILELMDLDAVLVAPSPGPMTLAAPRG